MILTYYCAVSMILIAYLLGSIPNAVWIGKKYYGIDIREHGSRNAGTTNMLRVLGRRAALPVFALDVLKGFVAVALLGLLKYDDNISDIWLINLKIIAVFAAVLGRIFPVFAHFKGGKGVATLVGAVLGIHPITVLLLLRYLVHRADDYALRVALIDDRGMLFSDLRAAVAQNQPLGAARRLLVRHRRTAHLDAPQEHRPAEKRHRVENLHLAPRRFQKAQRPR